MDAKSSLRSSQCPMLPMPVAPVLTLSKSPLGTAAGEGDLGLTRQIQADLTETSAVWVQKGRNIGLFLSLDELMTTRMLKFLSRLNKALDGRNGRNEETFSRKLYHHQCPPHSRNKNESRKRGIFC
jgi:hypothetical protein